MDHIIRARLKVKHPNLLIRVFTLGRPKIGFIFNYRAFLFAYGSSDEAISVMDEMSNDEKISLICYGAAIEYCLEHKKIVYFTKDDIQNALLKASLETNQKIGKAMSYARMPDWLNDIVENLPKDKMPEGIKKK